MRRFALGRKRGALCHAEAVLLVRHDRAQPVEGHALLDERVCADHDLRRAGLDCGERGTLLRRGHRAGEQGARDAQLVQQRGEGFGVLGCEDFSRRHKGGLPAVLRGKRAQRGRDHGLARADVALHQPVHRPAGGAVRRDLIDRAALRARGRKGQGRQVIRKPGVRKDNARVCFPALLELLQAAAQQEQLLEHHAAARRRDFVRALRAVDGGKCVRRVQQAVFRAQHRGQGVRPVTRHGGKRRIGHADKVGLVQPCGQRVDRHNAAGRVRVRRDLFRLWGNQLAPPPPALHAAVEHILLPDAQLRHHIGGVEPGHRQRAGFVKNRALGQGQPLADAADLGLGTHDRADGVFVLCAEIRNAGEHRAVLIVARISLERVAQRADMQFFKQLCLFRADAFDKLYAVIQCGHGLLLWFA